MYNAKSRNWKKALTLLLTLALLFPTMGAALVEETGQGSIAAFDTLSSGIKEQNVPPGTAQKDLTLPDTLDATDEDGNPVEITGVTWECNAPATGYDADTPGEYAFAPNIPALYTVGANAALLKITVTVKMPTPTPTRTEPETKPTDTAQLGSIGGAVWVDANEDGVRDSAITNLHAGVGTPPDQQPMTSLVGIDKGAVNLSGEPSFYGEDFVEYSLIIRNTGNDDITNPIITDIMDMALIKGDPRPYAAFIVDDNYSTADITDTSAFELIGGSVSYKTDNPLSGNHIAQGNISPPPALGKWGLVFNKGNLGDPLTIPTGRALIIKYVVQIDAGASAGQQISNSFTVAYDDGTGVIATATVDNHTITISPKAPLLYVSKTYAGPTDTIVRTSPPYTTLVHLDSVTGAGNAMTFKLTGEFNKMMGGSYDGEVKTLIIKDELPAELQGAQYEYTYQLFSADGSSLSPRDYDDYYVAVDVTSPEALQFTVAKERGDGLPEGFRIEMTLSFIGVSANKFTFDSNGTSDLSNPVFITATNASDVYPEFLYKLTPDTGYEYVAGKFGSGNYGLRNYHKLVIVRYSDELVGISKRVLCVSNDTNDTATLNLPSNETIEYEIKIVNNGSPIELDNKEASFYDLLPPGQKYVANSLCYSENGSFFIYAGANVQPKENIITDPLTGHSRQRLDFLHVIQGGQAKTYYFRFIAEVTVADNASANALIDSGLVASYDNEVALAVPDKNKTLYSVGGAAMGQRYAGAPDDPSAPAAGYVKTVVAADGIDYSNYNLFYASTEIYYVTEQITVSVTDVTLDKMVLALTVNDTATLTAAVAPDSATNKAVIWSSDNPSVATVNNGKVTAVSPGKATITVTTQDGNKTATCEVTVSDSTPPPPVNVPVTGVTLNKTALALTVNDTETLTATVAPNNANNKAVTWSSDNPSIATVNSGVVTAVSAGKVAIMVTTQDGNNTATCEVTVGELAYAFTGGGFPVVTDSTLSVQGTIDTDFANFGNGSVLVNGVRLSMPSQAEVTSGSTIVTIKPTFLQTLQNGSYPVEVRFENGGVARTTLVVDVQGDTPATQYTIKASAGTHGSISPSGDVKASKGSSFTFDITPDNGYTIDTLMVDGKKATTTNNTYTFSNVRADHSIHVTFKTATGLPKTGDGNNMMLWMITCLLSSLGVLCLLVWRKWRDMKALK